MASTLNINALNHADETNLRVVSHYLGYYSVLSALRSVVFTLPEVDWKAGELFHMTHQRTINLAFDHISQFDRKVAVEIKASIYQLKAFREMISYRAHQKVTPVLIAAFQ